MSNTLNGKVAVVTGASKGIGAEIAVALARAGANVVVNYASSRAGADKVVTQIQSTEGKAVAVQADLSKPEQIESLFAEAINSFGRLDILVNNAGVYEFGAIDAVTPDNFHRQFNVNVLGLLLASQAAVKRMGPDGGSIINISSTVSRAAVAGSSVYSGTKGAVDAITRALSAELGGRKIRVNAINPGMVETEGVHAAGFAESDFRKSIEAASSLGRIGLPSDIAPLAVFLAGADSSWMTGETLFINGGQKS